MDTRGGEAPVQLPSFKFLKPPRIAMSGKMKDNPGSGQIWNLILGVFRAEAALIAQEFFAASIFSDVSSGQRLQLAAEQRPDRLLRQLSMQHAASSFPNVYRLLTILGTLPVTTSESEWVFFKLQRKLTQWRR